MTKGSPFCIMAATATDLSPKVFAQEYAGILELLRVETVVAPLRLNEIAAVRENAGPVFTNPYGTNFLDRRDNFRVNAQDGAIEPG